jgi:hypothetical protein
MSPSRTLQDIHKELTTQWGLATPHSFKLHFERADGVMDTPTEIEDVWDLLQDEQVAGRWVFRAITPITPPSARLALEPNSVTSENVSRRLSYDNGDADPAAQLTRALRLQQFEQSVVAEIKAAVKLAVQQYGDKVCQAGQFPAETFYKALRVTEDLTKLLDRLTKEALRRADPTAEQQRLRWFIEAILDLLEGDVKERWHGQDDPEQREASYYTTWAQFKASLFTIIRNVTDFTPDGLMEQLPKLVSPAKCASRKDLWVAIEQVQRAAKTLAEMKSTDATAQIEAATVKYLEASLTQEATKGICEALAYKHRDAASAYFASMQHPPLTAYPSRCIKAVMLGRDDFAGPWRADWRVIPNKEPAAAAQPSKGGGSGTQRVENPKPSNNGSGSPRTRVLTRNQESHVFPYYLKDVTDASERARQETKFLGHSLLDWKCRKCGVQGHTQDICPRLFKLDARSIERNPRSFFFELRPPQQVLNLRTAATIMPVLEARAAPSPHSPLPGPAPLSSIELDPEELQAFQAWRAGQQLGN